MPTRKLPDDAHDTPAERRRCERRLEVVEALRRALRDQTGRRRPAAPDGLVRQDRER